MGIDPCYIGPYFTAEVEKQKKEMPCTKRERISMKSMTIK